MIQADNSNNNDQNLFCPNKLIKRSSILLYSFMAVLGPTLLNTWYTIALVTCNTFYKYIEILLPSDLSLYDFNAHWQCNIIFN